MSEPGAGENVSEVNHIPFNPHPLTIGDSPLGRICDEWGRGGWQLLRVVPVHQFEAIAVFVRGEADG